jgi:signal transduction histidine kinase/CheY-like chemotaxis protein
MRTSWVQNRQNFISLAENDPQYEGVADVIHRGINRETGIGFFSLAGVPRICALKPITESEEGWFLGVIAPLPESTFRNSSTGLIVVGIVSFLLSIIAAVIASGFIKKPFEEAAQLKETAEANSRTKSKFLANMSHEMRTPMNVVIGLTDLMQEDEEITPAVKKNLDKINIAGNTLMGLINDVLDISKIEAGKLELIPVKYDTASLLNDIIVLNMIRIGEKPITFNLDINENLPQTLLGDDLRVKQIANNLLSNAFKYTMKGNVTLAVDCEYDSSDGVWISFRVSDTGIGIRAEDMVKLFGDYNQLDIKANRKIEGTGLGLSITKMFTEMMNGEISVQSEYGKGTTFNVRIYQGYVTDRRIGKTVVENLSSFRYSDKKKQAHEKLVRSDLNYASVLVVDDLQMNLDVAAGMLRKYKMQVDCVTTGQEAIDRVSAGEPVYNSIFMDHMMPGMDGIEATRKIRDLGTQYAQEIPVIALTANAVAGNEKMFLDNGFNAFLPKPFNTMLLNTIIEKWVRDKSKE